MFVENIKIGELQGKKSSSKECIISFNSPNFYPICTNFLLQHDSKNHYFEVCGIDTDCNIIGDRQLYYEAKEVGYWGGKFTNQPVDLRKLLAKEIFEVIDEDVKKKIIEESSWC